MNKKYKFTHLSSEELLDCYTTELMCSIYEQEGGIYPTTEDREFIKAIVEEILNRMDSYILVK